jgi:D-serine deaminase-like pyridoxal phosphate-dependent protein
VRLRPHAKTHKSPEVARRQMALGAVGVCCQKVAEAEVMVAGGITDVLVSNEVAGARKLARLAALARRARIGICVDAAANVEEIERAAAAAEVAIDVLVEIDVGGRRCG